MASFPIHLFFPHFSSINLACVSAFDITNIVRHPNNERSIRISERPHESTGICTLLRWNRISWKKLFGIDVLEDIPCLSNKYRQFRLVPTLMFFTRRIRDDSLHKNIIQTFRTQRIPHSSQIVRINLLEIILLYNGSTNQNQYGTHTLKRRNVGISLIES